jgi:hypothetical protein
MRRSKPRLTSLGAFGFSAGWVWAPSDADVVRGLLVFLEDRRALAYGHIREDVEHVVSSVLEIRKELIKTLRALTPDSGASRSIRRLREACVAFLDRNGSRQTQQFDNEFVASLRELQAEFVHWVRVLADEYRIDVDGPLAALLIEADDAEREGRKSDSGGRSPA